MAMRPRASGIASVRTRPVMRPANENFKPKSEWKHEEGASILSVYLPGFVKEQIKMQIDESTRLIRVEGQRPLPNARSIRFNEGFSIPENCDITKINSQFGSGILRITMPKIVTTQSSPKEEAQTTQEVPRPEESTGEQKPQSSIANVEKQRDDQNVKAQIPQKPAMSPENENFKPKSEWKQEEGASILSVYVPGFLEEQIMMQIDESPRLIRVKGQRPLPNARWISFNEGFSIPEYCDITKINVHFGSGIFRITMPKIVTTQISPKEEAKTTQEVPRPEEVKDQQKPQKGQEDSSPKASSSSTTNFKEKEKSYEEKAKEDFTAGELKEMEMVTASSNKVLKGLAMGMDQKRQLVVNIGTSLLVIVGLGVYIFYSSES